MKNRIYKFIMFGLVALIASSSIMINSYAKANSDNIVLKENNESDEISGENSDEANLRLCGIGSVSKVFVTAAAMQLYDKGLIDLDQPVVTYIPEFKMADERYMDITVRMLMNHTSGLMGTSNYGALMGIDNNDTGYHDKFLERLSKQSLKAAPGAFSAYCNDGFMLLEIVVERVSGKSFTDYVTENINAPLGLVQTGSAQNAFRRENMINVYDGNVSIYPEYCSAIGAGGVLSTAEELATFGTGFFTGNTKLLSDNAKNEMKKSYSKDEYSDDYGLGWDYVNMKQYEDAGIQVIGKGGDCNTQHAGLLVAPDQKISVAVVSSGGSSMFDELMAQKLLNIALEEKGIHIEDIKADKLETVEIIPEEYKKYEGIYLIGGAFYKITFPEMKCLRMEEMESTKSNKFDYLLTVNDTFVLIDGDVLEGSTAQDKTENEVFFAEENGVVFVKNKLVSDVTNLGSMEVKSYAGQKMDESSFDDKYMDVWKAREGKYYLLSGKYYESGIKMIPYMEIKVMNEVPGYIEVDNSGVSLKISDEKMACTFSQTPGCRDQMNVEMIQRDGSEYVSFTGFDELFIPESEIEILSDNKIDMDTVSGEYKWYSIGDNIANMTATIDRSDKTSVWILNEYDKIIYHSYMKDYDDNIPLPQNGKIAIAGEDGEHISITIE